LMNERAVHATEGGEAVTLLFATLVVLLTSACGAAQ